MRLNSFQEINHTNTNAISKQKTKIKRYTYTIVVNNMLTIGASYGRIAFRYNSLDCSRCTPYFGCNATFIHQPRWSEYTQKMNH